MPPDSAPLVDVPGDGIGVERPIDLDKLPDQVIETVAPS